MKMQPFLLEKALAGHPVVTRDGRRVADLTHFKTADSYCLAGVVEGEGFISTWRKDGSCDYTNILFLEVKTVKRWARVVLYCGAPLISVIGLKTREEAEVSLGLDAGVLPAYAYEIEE
jgi:hypothetical protein